MRKLTQRFQVCPKLSLRTSPWTPFPSGPHQRALLLIVICPAPRTGCAEGKRLLESLSNRKLAQGMSDRRGTKPRHLKNAPPGPSLKGTALVMNPGSEEHSRGSNLETDEATHLLSICSICMRKYKSCNCRYYRYIFHYHQHCIFII